MSDEVLNREFLADLRTEYQHVRENRSVDLLKLAGSAIFGADAQRRYLDAALAFDPKAMAATLHDMLSCDTTAPRDRISAATLYQHGGSMGWWETPPPAAERARLIIALKKDQPIKDEPRRTRPSKVRVAVMAADDDRSFYIAISQACNRMEASLKDPAATGETKLEAIARFFRIAGRIAPDQLDASIAKAWKILNPQPRSK
jgi:hypothetical protein